MTQRFHYGRLMHKAMRGLVAEVLTQVSQDGLQGEHHFFISFDTTHPGVDISNALRAKYPEEMTIVLQHTFDDLAVMSDRFTVTLSFGDVPEPLVIPFEAMNTFIDPSVEFGLRFDGVEDSIEGDDDEHEPERAPKAEKKTERKENDGGDVVSLDRFRKH